MARSVLPFLAMPATDQGKCATGMMKKLSCFRQSGAPLIKDVCNLWKREDVPVAVVCNTGEGVVPSQEGGQKSEKASGFDDGWVRVTFLVAVEIADAEQEESDIEGEEEAEEGDGGAEGEDEEDGGEDEPALWSRRCLVHG